MDIGFIFKIAAIGIIVAVLNQVLVRSGREEHAMLITIAAERATERTLAVIFFLILYFTLHIEIYITFCRTFPGVRQNMIPKIIIS